MIRGKDKQEEQLNDKEIKDEPSETQLSKLPAGLLWVNRMMARLGGGLEKEGEKAPMFHDMITLHGLLIGVGLGKCCHYSCL